MAGQAMLAAQFVAAAEKVTGEPIRLEHVPAKAGEMPAVVVSIARARALGYRPAVALEDGLASAWDDFRRSIFDMTEGRRALVSWQYEHGDVGHKAERAAYGAALGIFSRDRVTHDQYVTLVRPMAEALPWLLPEAPPEPHE